ncbi:MAG TPA: ABC transporter permease subunit, partial [Candidatus Obscuribacterales bacterium]
AALGLGRWAMIRGVVLPAARSGLITGVILETGRAIGETMAVLMVCGNVVQVPHSLFDPVRTLTANIALEMAYAVDNHRAALFVSGLVLMGLIALLVAIAELLNRGQYD